MISPNIPPLGWILELLNEARKRARSSGGGQVDYVYMVTKSAQMGWDQRGAATEAELQKARDEELNECCEWLDFYSSATDARDLRLARRPKPPSLKEQALLQLDTLNIPMIDKHPITPPPELVQQWIAESASEHNPTVAYSLVGLLATAAAQWGADQELEACCEWLNKSRYGARLAVNGVIEQLRAARRPKLPSEADQALLQLDTLNADLAMHGRGCDLSQIRRALERLKELEALSND